MSGPETERNGDDCLMGRGFPFGVMESFTSRWPHNILNVLNATELYTKMINFLLYIFQFNKKYHRLYARKVCFNLLFSKITFNKHIRKYDIMYC